jgi:hypothetical protein
MQDVRYRSEKNVDHHKEEGDDEEPIHDTDNNVEKLKT